MVEDLIKRLKEAAQAATPQNLDTAQTVERYEDGSHITCPTCGGEGYAELNSDFCNYDGKAIGVQFYGIGPEHSAAEAYFRAASPAAILELIAMIEQQVARLTALESERDALLAAAGKEAVKAAPVGFMMKHKTGMDIGFAWKANDPQFSQDWIRIPLYAAPTAAQCTVPAGLKLVPVEPTESMVVDGFESWPSRMFSEPEEWIAYEAMSGCQQAAHKARLCYAAMVAAAPTAALENGGGRAQAFDALLAACQEAIDWYPSDAAPPYMRYIREAVALSLSQKAGEQQ
jgi:hypothetical protein